MWLIKVLVYITNFIPVSNIKFICYDNKYRNRRQQNICNIFISAYILTIWKTRKENLRIGIIKKMIINKSQDIINIIKYSSKTHIDIVLGNYLVKIEPELLLRL